MILADLLKNPSLKKRIPVAKCISWGEKDLLYSLRFQSMVQVQEANSSRRNGCLKNLPETSLEKYNFSQVENIIFIF